MNHKKALTKIGVAAIFLALGLGTAALATGRGGDQGIGAGGRSPGAASLNDHFARQIVGSYLADFPDGSRLLLCLGNGGVAHRETSDDFLGLSGWPDLPFARYGGGFGNWTRTGPRSIRIVELAFQFGEDGFLSAISKGTVDIGFGADLNSAAGSVVMGIYSPAQDPLTEEPVDTVAFDGITLRRIR